MNQSISAKSPHYPFGMLTPGRNWSAGNEYRFGFSGMEQDNELHGNGNSYDFNFRIYDSRVGRFLSTDPLEKEFAWNSTYAYAMNRVIDGVDLEGSEYVDGDESRVSIVDGIIKLKLENMTGPYRNVVYQMRAHGNDPGVILEVLDVTITDATNAYNQPSIVYHTKTEQIDRQGNKKNSIDNTQSKTSAVTYIITSNKALSRANAAIAVLGYAEDYLNGKAQAMIDEDNNLINQHTKFAHQALNAVNKASGDGGYIENNFMSGKETGTHLSNIANFILSGTVGYSDESIAQDAGFSNVSDYNKAIKDTAIPIMKNISNNYKEFGTYKTEFTGGGGLDGFKGNEVPVFQSLKTEDNK
ncbi:MAG: hypothetical protein KBF51_08730 [Chitinophagales bacterium]|nr:hypothetical protein [Chitinophagales bacterium]MBP9705227.1 hypothetical protein [Chitinophagales bacterium]